MEEGNLVKLKHFDTILNFIFIMLQIVGYLLVVLLLTVIIFKTYENNLLLSEVLETLSSK